MQDKKQSTLDIFDGPTTLSQVLFEPRPETIVGFIAGLLLFGITTNLLWDLLQGKFPSLYAFLAIIGAVLLLFWIAYASFQRIRRQARQIGFRVEENTMTPPQRRGLVWVLSPSGTEHTMVAIRHHYGTGEEFNRLRHCWLIQQRNNRKVTEERHTLEKELLDSECEVELHTVLVDELSVRAAYDALLTIVDNDAPAHNVPLSSLIVDITGGTKPLTAGLVLGALTTDCLLQYVETQRDLDGKPFPETAQVVNVSRQAYLRSTRRSR